MKDDQEITEIMRAMLEGKLAQAKSKLSARDNRIVSISTRADERAIQLRITSERVGMLKFPIIQAIIGCLIFGGVCLVGVCVSVKGEHLSLSAAMIAVSGLALILMPVMQLLLNTKHTRHAGLLRN